MCTNVTAIVARNSARLRRSISSRNSTATSVPRTWAMSLSVAPMAQSAFSNPPDAEEATGRELITRSLAGVGQRLDPFDPGGNLLLRLLLGNCVSLPDLAGEQLALAGD